MKSLNAYIRDFDFYVRNFYYNYFYDSSLEEISIFLFLYYRFLLFIYLRFLSRLRSKYIPADACSTVYFFMFCRRSFISDLETLKYRVCSYYPARLFDDDIPF